MQIDPFIDSISDWKRIIKNKHVLFDACAIIKLIDFKAESILAQFIKLDCTLTYINPVFIELMRTDRLPDRIERSRILNEYGFVQIAMTPSMLKKASDIQEELHAVNCHPDPEDIYLGATINILKNDQYLITNNHKHFPSPIYKRQAQIIIQNDREMQILSILSYNEVGK